jgi:hypothetical protein
MRRLGINTAVWLSSERRDLSLRKDQGWWEETDVAWKSGISSGDPSGCWIWEMPGVEGLQLKQYRFLGEMEVNPI